MINFAALIEQFQLTVICVSTVYVQDININKIIHILGTSTITKYTRCHYAENYNGKYPKIINTSLSVLKKMLVLGLEFRKCLSE